MAESDKKQIEAAKKLSLPILQHLEKKEGVVGLVERLGKPVCDAIVTYGCRNQIAAVETVVALEPALEKSIEKCFGLLSEALEISTNLNAEEYETIARIVVEASDLSTKEKTALVVSSISELKHNRAEETKSVITRIGIVAAGGYSVATLVKSLGKIAEELSKAKGEAMIIESKADGSAKKLEKFIELIREIKK